MSTKESNQNPKILIFLIIIVCITVILAWIANYWGLSSRTIQSLPPESTATSPLPQTFAELGDSFGALNALFSGFAFIGVVIAIFLQQQELKETRIELANAAKAQQEQVSNQITSSKLQALSTLLEYYNQNNKTRTDIIAQKRTKGEIELLLDELYGVPEPQFKFFDLYTEDLAEFSRLTLMDREEFFNKYKISQRMFLEYSIRMMDKDEKLLRIYEMHKLGKKLGPDLISKIMSTSKKT